jgi:hypothetical protein
MTTRPKGTQRNSLVPFVVNVPSGLIKKRGRRAQTPPYRVAPEARSYWFAFRIISVPLSKWTLLLFEVIVLEAEFVVDDTKLRFGIPTTP